MTDSYPHEVLDALLDRCLDYRTPCGDGHLVWRIWNGSDSQRPPLVMLHGGSGAWNHWVRTIPALEPHFRVIAPDLPGCGDSADPPAPCDADSLATLLSDGLDLVMADDTPFHLVSFSFGGLLSGLIAHAQARRILSLTIVGSPILGLNRTGPANDLSSVPPGLSPQEAAPIYRSNLQKLMVRDPAAVDDLAMALHMTNMAKVRLRSRSIARARPMSETLRGSALPLELHLRRQRRDAASGPGRHSRPCGTHLPGGKLLRHLQLRPLGPIRVSRRFQCAADEAIGDRKGRFADG